MADKKISAMTELAIEPASGDYFPIVDISEALAEDKNKRILWSTIEPLFVRVDGTNALTADWDVGSFKITAEQLESDIATGTAPLIISSTTKVSNLNVDQVDGYDLDQNVTSGSAPNFTADNFSDGGSNAIITITQETNYDTAYTHSQGNGADHANVATNTSNISALSGFIDQSVTTGSSPTFDGNNFSGIPDGALDETYINADGTVALTADWDIGDGRYIAADQIQARDGDGLALLNDGGDGIYVHDNGYVSIGSDSTPPSRLTMVGTDLATSSFETARYSDNEYGPYFRIRKSRGTESVPVIPNTGDAMGGIRWLGKTTSGGSPTGWRYTADIWSYAEGTVSGDSIPGNLVFATNSGTDTDPVTRMTINSSGDTWIGGTPADDHRLYISYTDSGSNNGFYIENTGSGSAGIRFRSASEDWRIMLDNNDTFLILDRYASFTAADERIYLGNRDAHTNGVNVHGTPAAEWHVNTYATDAAVPVLRLDQADVDDSFIYFGGTAGSGNSIDTRTTSGATTHHLLIEINGTPAWIAASTNTPS